MVIIIKVISEVEVTWSLRPHGLLSPWNSPYQNTEVGSLSLLQVIFPAKELNQGSPALQMDSLPTELSGKPIRVISSLLCCKEQYCIGAWNVRSMNQGKLEVVK